MSETFAAVALPPGPQLVAPRRGWIPLLVVFAITAGGALAFGAWWKANQSASVGGAAGEWCADHNVPEGECVECNPDLLGEKTHAWCKLHGVMDCPLCHPELAQLPKPPEVSQEMLDEMLNKAAAALALRERPKNNSRCQSARHYIQFATAEVADKAGVEVQPAWTQEVVETLPAVGELGYDEEQLAHLSARSGGSVWRVLKQVGDVVEKGELLALVDSSGVGQAKAGFLKALVDEELKAVSLARLKSAGNAIPEQKVREAEAAHREAEIALLNAQQSLVNLGLPIDPADYRGLTKDQLREQIQFLELPADMASSLDGKSTTGNLLPVRSSLAGVVVARHVVEGEVVDESEVLFTVADIDSMWLNLDVRLEEIGLVQPGSLVQFRADGATADAEGKVIWIAPEVDSKTRTVRVRAVLDNTNRKLRANAFGAGKIILRTDPAAVVVPNDAIQTDGDCQIVFVRDRNYLKDGSPKMFHVRTVRIGHKDDEVTEIIVGVLPGEIVATGGSAALVGQLLKSNLGAGCCGGHGHKH